MVPSERDYPRDLVAGLNENVVEIAETLKISSAVWVSHVNRERVC